MEAKVAPIKLARVSFLFILDVFISSILIFLCICEEKRIFNVNFRLLVGNTNVCVLEVTSVPNGLLLFNILIFAGDEGFGPNRFARAMYSGTYMLI